MLPILPAAADVEPALPSGQIQQHHIRPLLNTFQHNIAAVRRNIEIANATRPPNRGTKRKGARLSVVPIKPRRRRFHAAAAGRSWVLPSRLSAMGLNLRPLGSGRGAGFRGMGRCTQNEYAGEGLGRGVRLADGPILGPPPRSPTSPSSPGKSPAKSQPASAQCSANSPPWPMPASSCVPRWAARSFTEPIATTPHLSRTPRPARKNDRAFDPQKEAPQGAAERHGGKSPGLQAGEIEPRRRRFLAAAGRSWGLPSRERWRQIPPRSPERHRSYWLPATGCPTCDFRTVRTPDFPCLASAKIRH